MGKVVFGKELEQPKSADQSLAVSAVSEVSVSLAETEEYKALQEQIGHTQSRLIKLIDKVGENERLTVRSLDQLAVAIQKLDEQVVSEHKDVKQLKLELSEIRKEFESSQTHLRKAVESKLEVMDAEVDMKILKALQSQREHFEAIQIVKFDSVREEISKVSRKVDELSFWSLLKKAVFGTK